MDRVWCALYRGYASVALAGTRLSVVPPMKQIVPKIPYVISMMDYRSTVEYGLNGRTTC